MTSPSSTTIDEHQRRDRESEPVAFVERLRGHDGRAAAIGRAVRTASRRFLAGRERLRGLGVAHGHMKAAVSHIRAWRMVGYASPVRNPVASGRLDEHRAQLRQLEFVEAGGEKVLRTLPDRSSIRSIVVSSASGGLPPRMMRRSGVTSTPWLATSSSIPSSHGPARFASVRA